MMAPYPWQQKQWMQLQQQYQTHRLPHAILLFGSAGSGKLSFGKAFAKKILCDKPGAVLDHHPDFYSITDEKTIKVDRIRECIDRVGKSANQGHYKVTLIYPAERMNIAASNAFLKTLEEPLGDTLFILISDDPARLLPTIRSRCHCLYFALPESRQAIEWLSTQMETEKAATLLALSSGSPLKALQWQGEDILTLRNHLLVALLKQWKGELNIVSASDYFVKKNPGLFLQILFIVLLDLGRLKSFGSQASVANSDAMDKLTVLANKISSDALFEYVDRVLEAKAMLMSPNNVNPILLLETLLCQA